MSAVLVLGLVNGLSTALLALGLVLVYKTGRFVNAAHAQLGVTSALLLGKFVLGWDWSWWIAFPAALAIGAGVGALCELWVIRRLEGRNPVSMLIATIGLSQILLALSYFRFLQADPMAVVQQGYPVPFDVRIDIGALVIRGQHILILVLVPLIAGALTVFLRYTVTGKAMRAVASNREAASLAGISVKRMATLAWAIAGVLSATSAILQAPSQTTFDLQALGPGLLLRALGAAAIGGMTSLPATFGAGIVLGLVEAAALHATRNGGTAEVLVFLTVLAGLFLRARLGDGPPQTDAPPAVDERRLVIPLAIAGRAFVRYQRAALGFVALWVAVLVPFLPMFESESSRFRLTLVLILAVVSVALTILGGWAGQVSLGHFAFVGAGAYVAVRLVPHGWSLIAIMLAAGLVGALIAILVGLPALRLSGLTLAVTTLGLAVVAPSWLFPQSWFGGRGNVAVDPPRLAGFGSLSSQLQVYFAALVTLAVVLWVAGRLRRSQPGRLVLAVRDNERAASAFGVTPTLVRVGTFALSGFIASAAGVLWAAAWRNVAETSFLPHESLLVLAMPVIGGLGSLPGAVLGSVFVFGVPAFTGDLMKSLFSNTVQFSLILAGAGLLVTQIQFPGGLAGALRRVWERILARVAADAAEREAATAEPGVSLLEVRDVRLSFGGVQALDGASIDVRPGEIVGLIGANGAGKTTLLNVIGGELRASDGSLRAFGQELRDRPAELRAHLGIARSFQDARLFPGLTVRETVQVASYRRGRPGVLASMFGAPWSRLHEQRTRAEADVLLERYGLTPWADSLTADLSTGMRRICDLVGQVSARPKVLLLDEPTAGVAQREAEAFSPLLRRIREELDCAVLLVEHDMPLMLGLADRIYCLEAGRVIAEGTPDEIVANPAVIASYLGTDPVAVERSGPLRRDETEPPIIKAKPKAKAKAKAKAKPEPEPEPTVIKPKPRSRAAAAPVAATPVPRRKSR